MAKYLRRNVWLLLLILSLVIFTAAPALAEDSYSFDYTITATGTQTVTTMPEQDFIWTVTAAGTEQWTWNGQITSYDYEMDADQRTDTWYWPQGGGKRVVYTILIPSGAYWGSILRAA